jgi:hypothetical protein
MLLLLEILLIFVASACITVIQPRHARLGQVIGIVDEPRSVSLRIMTTNKDVREVQTDLKTRYTKWLTHQPYTVDKIVDAKSLTVGRCVRVTVRKDDVHVAQEIEISLDRSDTLYDPCRMIR